MPIPTYLTRQRENSTAPISITGAAPGTVIGIEPNNSVIDITGQAPQAYTITIDSQNLDNSTRGNPITLTSKQPYRIIVCVGANYSVNTHRSNPLQQNQTRTDHQSQTNQTNPSNHSEEPEGNQPAAANIENDHLANSLVNDTNGSVEGNSSQNVPTNRASESEETISTTLNNLFQVAACSQAEKAQAACTQAEKQAEQAKSFAQLAKELAEFADGISQKFESNNLLKLFLNFTTIQSAAKSAQDAANTANEKAKSAQDAANTANEKAKSAQDAFKEAVASNAVKFVQAKKFAQEAQSALNDAKKFAQEAQSALNDAREFAQEAQSALNDARESVNLISDDH